MKGHVILGALCLSFLPCFGTGTDDRTPMVSNPGGRGAFEMVFREELRFGGTQDHELWLDGRVSATFDVDRRGHFFVVDQKHSRVQEFDAQGNYVGVFARKGEGPGEFQNIVSLQVLEDGRMIGHDFLLAVSKFSSFSPQRRYLDTQTVNDLSKILYRVDYAPDGAHFFGWVWRFEPETRKTHFQSGLFDQAREPLIILAESPWPTQDRTRLSESSYWVEYVAAQLASLWNRNGIFASFLASGDVMVVRGDGYRLEQWSKGYGRHQFTVTKDFEPQPFSQRNKRALAAYLHETIMEQGPQYRDIVTEEVMVRAVEAADLPDRLNPILGLVPTESGGFLVIHQASFEDGAISGHWFRKNGEHQGWFKFPGKGVFDMFGTRLKFRNGFAYAMERSEDGDNQMVRYRIEIEGSL